jgi:hypothetical protein
MIFSCLGVEGTFGQFPTERPVVDRYGAELDIEQSRALSFFRTTNIFSAD